MKRRVRICSVVAAAVLAVGVLVPTAPAGAAVHCTVAGKMTINPGLHNEVVVNVGPQIQVLVGALNVVHIFTITGTSSCVHVKATPPGVDTSKNILPANGVVKGFCNRAGGLGVLANGTLFAFVIAGAQVTLTGHAAGEMTMVVDPTVPDNSCAHGAPVTQLPGPRALTFVIGGAVKLLNCTPGLQPAVPGTPGDTEKLLRIVDTSLLVATVHASAHIGVHKYARGTCRPQAL